jgi:hypothetical protein
VKRKQNKQPSRSRNPNKIKYDKHLIWLRPYTEAVADLVPIERLKSVKLRLYSNDKPPSYHGICERLNNYKSYNIIVRTYEKSDKRWPMSPTSQEMLLCNYAHEITHLLIFEDCVEERFLLETKVYSRFGEVLMARGYEQKLNKQS